MKDFMDDFGVLDRLFFDRFAPGNAESIFRLLGMVHLYRASGVHLLAFFTLLSLSVEWIFKSFKLNVEYSRFLSLLLSCLSIFYIWNLQSFRVTLIRPILTFLIRELFRQRGHRLRIWVPLTLTFIIESILSTDTAFSEGALHYYLSVGGGLFAYSLDPKATKIKRHVFLALGSWLPIAGISLFRDHLVSYMTAIYSLISIPVITTLLYPLTLLDLLIHSHISPGTVQAWNLFLRLLFWLPDQGVTFVVVSTPSIWISLPIAMFFGFYWNKIKSPLIVFCLFCPFAWGFGGELNLYFLQKIKIAQLDVHQGDSCAIQYQNERTEMIDVGSLRTYAADTWIKKFSKLGMTSIDGVLLSHLDEDHSGALKELSYLIPIACVETHPELWNSEKGIKLQKWIRENNPRIIPKGNGCVRLPKIAWFRSASSHSNGNELMGGVALELTPNEAYFALGDGDATQELQFEQYFKSEISLHPLRIWKVGHHGSRFSSDMDFLSRLSAKELWISVGKKNPYHHPHPTTLFKLNQSGGSIYRTDVDGDLIRSFNE